MKSEKLDRKITLKRASYSTNGLGEQVATWFDLATGVWATQRRATARETLAAAELSASVSDVFEIRFDSSWANLSALDRIEASGREYDIQSVDEIGRRAGLRIAAVARGDVAQTLFVPGLDFRFAVNSMYVPLI